MTSQFPDDEARTKDEMLDNFLQQVIKFNTVLQEQIADLKNRLSDALKRVKELEATMIDAIEAPEEAANEGDRILHNRKLTTIGEIK